MVGTDQTGVLVLGVMDDVIKGDLPEELQVRPGVVELSVMPLRFFPEACSITGGERQIEEERVRVTVPGRD